MRLWQVLQRADSDALVHVLYALANLASKVILRLPQRYAEHACLEA